MSEAGVVRKLTTIMAADVVGYSRLMATNEEATLHKLKTYRAVIDGLIEKHGGRIFNTAGDAVLAEFGSAVEAVRCAVSIQEDLAARNSQLNDAEQMWFRIGINVGDVIIEGDDLFGDGVNVAARLEGLAERGGICISGGTFEQVKNKLSVAFADMGPQTVKNIPEAVSAFRIIPGKVSVQSGGDSRDFVTDQVKHNKHLLLRLALIALVISIVSAGFFYVLQGRQRQEVGHPFDGKWEVSVHSRSGCLRNDDTSYFIHIVDGLINEPEQPLPKTGSVNKDGQIRIEVSSRDGRPMNIQTGRIIGDAGEGQFMGAKPSCRGSISIKRIS